MFASLCRRAMAAVNGSEQTLQRISLSLLVGGEMPMPGSADHNPNRSHAVKNGPRRSFAL